MIPDFSGLIWFIATVVSQIIWVSLASLFIFWVMPSISRTFISAKWRGGVPAFIQNETGKVELCTSDKVLPEGVVHYKGKGWFIIAKRPYDNLDAMDNKERKRIRDAYVKVRMAEDRLSKEDALEAFEKLGVATELTEEEKEQAKDTIEKLIHTPILEGFNKQVFFGCTDSVALSNLKSISEVTDNAEVTGNEKHVTKGIVDTVKVMAHANLRNCRLLAPIMYSKTQLDALATGNRLEGMKMMGRDTTKWILAAICVIGVVATVGIIAYLLIQG